jgi:hypothetical protein
MGSSEPSVGKTPACQNSACLSWIPATGPWNKESRSGRRSGAASTKLRDELPPLDATREQVCWSPAPFEGVTRAGSLDAAPKRRRVHSEQPATGGRRIPASVAGTERPLNQSHRLVRRLLGSRLVSRRCGLDGRTGRHARGCARRRIGHPAVPLHPLDLVGNGFALCGTLRGGTGRRGTRRRSARCRTRCRTGRRTRRGARCSVRNLRHAGVALRLLPK